MKTQKLSILAHLIGDQSTLVKHPRHLWLATGVAGISLFGMVAAFGTASDTRFEIVPQREIVENLSLPVSSGAGSEPLSLLHEERIRQGDTVGDLFRRLHIDDQQALDFIRSNSSTQALFRQLSPGKNLAARTGPNQELHSLIFPLNGSKDQALVVERTHDGFKASEQPLTLETQVVMKSAEIRYSLFGAADAAGIPDAVATQLADIFGGDVDFHRDIKKGDRFSVIYESVTHLGHPVRAGRILAAEFVNNGKTYRAAWFADPADPAGSGGYYTADGKNIRKAFLRSPLEFSRITSGFTSARFHPILQKWRAHKGVDYGAPIGARVKATGDGVVEVAGVQGGYGKVIILRHQSRYTTLYGHLSGFAAGLHKGSRVSQGDVIGYVGATGLASGPHLHYEFRINDVHQNPLAIALPSAPPLTPAQLTAFKKTTSPRLAQIEQIRGLALAQLD